ncbi:hypothetical protein NHH03_15005 [Stieleria sp. TO1_6]|uniref:hypothetical protein n=1 Tax=Stieleria tagensis TaxID=2956795 RepID=UPI00209A933A|nr:hypothetical protein [Stieleria tagensis]MCO8123054.1 hypothetical protein [Stieleria tagensis]
MPEFAEFAKPLAQSLSTELRSAIQSAPLPPLGEGSRHAPLVPLLTGGIGDHLTGVAAGRQMECLSGFWLVAGDIHQSHSISQDLGSAEGSFLHGIMHRREGDFGNAKYWFRRVGGHPVLEQLPDLTAGVYENASGFVDQCQSALQSDDADQIDRCTNAQWVEWQALMQWLIG